MARKVRFGVLSTANIALKKVIPGMQQGELCKIAAIASRDLGKAKAAAELLGIAKAYGSYEELLADPEIDAIYNPLPNDLHVPWSIKAAEAGKHVLCEKPIGLNVAEARRLIEARDRTGVKMAEAFMVRLHPQWIRARELVDAGRIGPLRLMQSAFSYYNVKPENIRNSVAAGGGALMDIGCYLIYFSSFLFNAQPSRVLALVDRDPEMKIDRLTSFLLDFSAGQSVASCSTQLTPYQRVQVFGTTGRIEVEIPVNTPPDQPTTIRINGEPETFPAVDQYTLQGDAFARAILEDTEVPVPLEQAVNTMAVIDALFRSAETGTWATPEASAG